MFSFLRQWQIEVRRSRSLKTRWRALPFCMPDVDRAPKWSWRAQTESKHDMRTKCTEIHFLHTLEATEENPTLSNEEECRHKLLRCLGLRGKRLLGAPESALFFYDADGSSSQMCPNFNFLRHFLTLANDINDFSNARLNDREANFNSAGIKRVSRWAQIQLFLFNTQKRYSCLFIPALSFRERKKLSGW